MIVTSPAFVNGKIAEKYGGRGTDFAEGGMPSLSFPFEIEGAPAGTASFAVMFDDPDAVEPCGFKWVHWLVSGLKTACVSENASRTMPELVQGCNDWYGRGIENKSEACFYGGPNPPDREHVYVLTVLALDFIPVLKTGFSQADLLKVTKDHVLAKATLKGGYPPKN